MASDPWLDRVDFAGIGHRCRFDSGGILIQTSNEIPDASELIANFPDHIVSWNEQGRIGLPEFTPDSRTETTTCNETPFNELRMS